jgi:hypothetical protein
MDLRQVLSTVGPMLLSALLAYLIARQTAARTLEADLAKLRLTFEADSAKLQQTFKGELSKLRLTAEASIFGRLLDARLGTYSGLYSLLSHLIKIGPRGPIDAVRLKELIHAVDAWDSQHAILLGPRTTNDCYFFRQGLKRLLLVTEDGALAEQVAEVGHEVLDLAGRLELALRADLGIYGVGAFKGEGKLITPTVLDYIDAEHLDRRHADG